MEKLLSTKEIADFLGVNEKMVYTLITEKGLPATKITGKWLFPKNLVEQWVESRTINYPKPLESAFQVPHLLLIAGSNDILLDRTLPLFRKKNPDFVALYGNLGSLGGLKALRQGLCHMATSHLADLDGKEYNFSYAATELEELPAVVNFCRREQGFLIPKGNPRNIGSVADIENHGLRVVNRPLEASTRLLFDQELQKAGLDCRTVKGYDREFQSHLEIGLEVLSGRADIGPGIHAVASLLDLDFLPLGWERFDLLIPKDGFFAEGVQMFLDLLHGGDFHRIAKDLAGYDLSLSGKMVYPQQSS
ncbi:MAG: helix-turn-helix transcriptional regulator [Desulfuromonadaceae bacterium]|nr:helix-turn-helix transcriptional regulator [Desulfuromonadaceae bacterium]